MASAVEQLVGAVLAVDLGVAVGAPRDALAALAREVSVAPSATLPLMRVSGGGSAGQDNGNSGKFKIGNTNFSLGWILKQG